jgi:hypothetical protein
MDLLDNMAMRYRHDYGLLPDHSKQSTRVSMSQLLEEVVFWFNEQAYNQTEVQKALAAKEASILLTSQLNGKI